VRLVGNKLASIQQWTIEQKLNIAALVEMWHDDASSSDTSSLQKNTGNYTD